MLRRALLALSLLVLGAVPPPARAEIKFNQQPALFQALQSHDVEAVRSAIANGENVNGREADGRSALIAAAIGRNAAIVRVSSAGRGGGKGGVSTCGSRWWPCLKK